MNDTLKRGRALSEELNPGMEAALDERYGKYLPGMAESLVDFAYGRQYAREALGLRERYLATIAASGFLPLASGCGSSSPAFARINASRAAANVPSR